MELSQIRYFYEAAAMQNLSRAAEKLHVSQPSLTKAIQRLEEELGMPLFDRTGRRIILNENGRRFMKEVEPLLEKVEEIQDKMAFSASGSQKKLVIGVCGECDIFNRCLGQFAAKNPDVRIDVRCNVERVERLDISEYDMLLYSTADENFVKYKGITICSDRLMLAVHKDSEFYDRLSARTEELQGQRLVMVRHDAMPSEIDRMLMRSGVRFGDITVTDGVSQQIGLVRAGLGLGPVFRSSCSAAFAEGDVRLIRLEGRDLTRDINICFKRDKLLSETGKKLKEHVLEFYKAKE